MDKRIMLRHSPDMSCIIAKDGTIIDINDECYPILGYTADEVRGKSCLEFIKLKDQEGLTKVFHELINGGPSYSFEYCFIKPDGAAVPVQANVNWLPEEQTAFCIVRDISELNKAKEEINRKEEFYQALVEHGSDLLALLNENGTYTYISANFSKALGYTPEEILGRTAFEFIHPDDLSQIINYWQLLTHEKHRYVPEFRFKNKSGGMEMV